MNQAVPVMGFVSRDDYPDFCSVCTDFPADAPDYDSWLKNVNQQLKGLRAQGIFPVQVNIKPLEMADWCKANGHKVDSRGRIAYATFVYIKLNK